MTLSNLLEFNRTQWRRPWVWVILAALVVANFVSDVLANPSPRAIPLWYQGAYLLVVLLDNTSNVWLGPWAWQWTGRSGAFPSFGRGLAQAILLGAASCTAVILLRVGLRAMIRPDSLPFAQYLIRTFAITDISMFCLLGFGIVAYQKEALARDEAERQAQEIQWILLKGQMNPHVFFDAMDHLTDLIRKDPRLAERAAMHLSDLFRRLMRHGQHHLAPLRQERHLVERYLDMEALRLGSRLRVAWDWEASMDDVLAPPFLLQPLVENAIKHALAPHPSGGELRITGHLKEGHVCIRVENTGGPLGPRHAEGGSLDALEARLRLAFDEDGSFDLGGADECTRAELRFPVLQEAV